MGLGIFALALWLIYGLELTINNIQIFPPIIAYIVLFIALIILYKNTHEKYFKYAMIYPIIYILLGYLSSLTKGIVSLISIVCLYYIFETIYKISNDYKKKDQFRFLYMTWLIIQIIMILMSLSHIESLIRLASYLLIIECVILIMMINHLIKINKELREEYENISYHIPTYNKKHYIIMIILCLFSLITVIVIEKPYTRLIKEEKIFTEEKFFKADGKGIKIPAFGYQADKETSLFYQSESTSYSPLKTYIRNDLINQLDYVKYRITYQDHLIYSLEGKASLYNNRNDGFIYVEYDVYDEYKEIEIEGQDIYDMEVLKDKDLKESSLLLHLELYDKNEKLYYSEDCQVNSVTPTTYRYEDEYISITDLQYDMNTIVKLPKVRLKDENMDITHINIFYPHEGEGENTLLFIYMYENGELDLDTRHHFIYDQVDQFDCIQIDYCNRDQIIESRLCQLEVVP